MIEDVNKQGEKLTCEIQSLENGTVVEFPYIYYPGYKITINGDKEEGFESENGFLAISLPEMSSSEVVVEYVGTNLMLVSKIISGMTLISIVIYIIYKKRRGKNMEKVAIVTGGSRGIGKAIVEALARKNIKVIANYNRSEEKAKILKEELEKENIFIDIFKADVSKREEVKVMVDYTIEKYGKIDILINNAGIDQEKMFQDITDEDWDNIVKVNLYSVFCTTQEVIPYMLKQKSGCIINMSSIYGTNGGSCAVAYSATKAGVDGMTKSLAKELGPSHIRVNSIAPGYIDTDMNEKYSKEEIEQIKEETPLEKIGKPVDIAKCIEWLVEDNFTTGQVISINGGWGIT